MYKDGYNDGFLRKYPNNFKVANTAYRNGYGAGYSLRKEIEKLQELRSSYTRSG